MQRDMDLIREILLEVEKSPTLNYCNVRISGRSPEELYYNALLAKEAGLIDARFLPNSTDFVVLRLTNDGHEFLEAARNHTIWNRAKEVVVKSTGGLTVEALKVVLPQLVIHALKVTGIGA